MNKHLSIAFLCILVLAITLRLIIAVWASTLPQNNDVVRLATWGRNIREYGISKAYTRKDGFANINYPPLSVYLISMLYNVYPPAFPILLRLLSVVFESIIGISIYIVVRKHAAEKRALIAASLFFFNPAVLYSGVFWGQIDAIHTTLFLFAFIFLLEKKYLIATLSSFLSLFSKLLLMYLAPLFLFLLILSLKQRMKHFAILIGSCLALLVILTLPISSHPISWLLTFFPRTMLGESPLITTGACNFWWVLFAPQVLNVIQTNGVIDLYIANTPLNTTPLLSIPLFLWGMLLFIVCTLPLFQILLRMKKVLPSTVFLISTSVLLIGFLFLPNMHERYFYPILAFFSTAIGLTGKFTRTFIALSLLHLTNLYIVWHPITFSKGIDILLATRDVQWTIAAAFVFTGIYCYIKIIRDTKIAP